MWTVLCCGRMCVCGCEYLAIRNKMCDRNDDLETGNKLYQRLQTKLKECNYQTVCFKCQTSAGYVLLQSKDIYCPDCLHKMVTQKFRATMGRSKQITTGDQMLLACSGGFNSMALVRLVVEGKVELADEHRRLRFVPSIHYVEESILTKDGPALSISYDVFEYLYNTGFSIFITSLESSFGSNAAAFLTFKQSDGETPRERYNRVEKYIRHCRDQSGEDFLSAYRRLQTPTARQDFLRHARELLSVGVAASAKMSWVAFASTATALATNLMTLVALGRGGQLPSETNLCDDRYAPHVRVIRPLMDFMDKEVIFYLYAQLPRAVFMGINSLKANPAAASTTKSSEIGRMTRTFLTNLQQSFPATVHTVYKTGSKVSTVGVVDKAEQRRCRFCWSAIDTAGTDGSECTAFQALQLTHRLSNKLEENEIHSDEFCYACLKIRFEMNRPIEADDGQQHVLESFCKQFEL